MKKLVLLILMLTAFDVAFGESFNQDYAYSNHWRLSRQLAEDNLDGNPLFLGTESLTMFAYNSESNPFNRYGVTVVSDPYAGRLIVGVNGWNRLSAYNMTLPSGLASSPQRLVFAASSQNKVYVLYYNSGSYQLVNAPRNWVYFSVGGVPSDVCWDDGGTADYDNDSFWVVRYEGGSATKYRYSFDWNAPPEEPRFEYTPILTIGGLVYPISIARGREENNSCPGCEAFGHNEWLYILELGGTVKCYTHPQTPPDNDNTDYDLEFTFNPGPDVNLTAISVDHTGVIWGSDANNHRLLTYYNNGSTLVPLDAMFSYGKTDNPNELCLPGKISLIETRAYNEDQYGNSWYSIDPYPALYVRELWSATTGGIKGSRGVDILNLSADWDSPEDPINRPVEITYKVTAFSTHTIGIRNSSGQNIRSIQRNDIPGDVAVLWDGKDNSGAQAPIDLYTFEILGHTTTFNTNAAPYFEVFELDRYGCVVNSQDSRVITYQVIDPNPEDTQFSYHWNVNNGTFASIDPPGHYGQDFTDTSDGDGMILWHPPGDWDMGAAPGPENANIVCTVKDLYPEGVYLSAIKGKNLWHCGEGCPFIYVLNGSDTLMQNNILNASIDTSGEGNLVFDYLFLNDDPQPSGFHYDFFIREDGLEKDSLDWVNLITIDHTTGSEVILSPAGDIYERLLTVSPSAAVDDRGIDVLAELQYPDGIYYTRSDSGWIDVTFDGLDTLSLALDSIPSGTIVMSPEKAITGGSTPGGPDPNIVTILIEVSPDNREPVDRIFPRAGKSHPSFIDLSEYFSDKMHVRYSWTRGYHADFVGYGWVRRITDGISFLQPSTAVFYDTVDVLSLVKKADNLFVGFEVAGFVNLSFPYEQIPGGKTRDFVFLCRGKYYTSDSLGSPKPAGDLLPRELGLSQNYPNPFNSTTIIKFATPIDQHISIEVFDILGRKVVTLLSEKVQAGYYEIFWEGQNSAGEAISSGIYFYKLRTVDKQILKKMLLLK